MRILNNQIVLTAIGLGLLALLVCSCSFDKLKLSIDKGRVNPNTPYPTGLGEVDALSNSVVAVRPLSEE